MARFGNIFLTLVLIGIVAAVITAGWLVRETNAPGPLAEKKLVYIAPGQSTRKISGELLENGVIDSRLAFRLAARLQGWLERLKAGEYQFQPGMSINAVIALMQSGKTYQRRITIPEGLTVTEIIDLLKKEPALTGDVATPPPEGSLLPETYEFSYGDTRQSVVSRMEKSMRAELQTLWEKRRPDLPLKTPEEAVVLASIVERETGLPAERPRVAGVFINRLGRRIPLQSDPTVIYAITQGHEKLDRPLMLRDLRTPSPYNTYVTTGLPPAPIANPGKASLAAVLNPEKNDYIYFVATGDGGHAFSKTLKEHNSNVARLRKREKQENR